MTIQVTYGPKAEQPLFEDVRPEDYFYDAVKWAAERGITDGVGGGLFGSGDPCTREQIVTFLWRAAGSPVVNYIMPSSDVDEDVWYAEAVRWAASEGIAAGKPDGTFGVGDACTRAQSVTFLFRAMGSHTKPGGSFSDVSADAWYAAAVEWAAARGVTSGIGGGLFAPVNSCTRAQIATFLYRCAK